uniref:Uncharacterized protein n=1 Tax=Glossina pallidipes TaxID=7398 RepID=A0A1B0AHK6_GLOPL
MFFHLDPVSASTTNVSMLFYLDPVSAMTVIKVRVILSERKELTNIKRKFYQRERLRTVLETNPSHEKDPSFKAASVEELQVYFIDVFGAKQTINLNVSSLLGQRTFINERKAYKWLTLYQTHNNHHHRHHHHHHHHHPHYLGEGE